MLSLPPSARIFLATTPVDMRRGFYGLLAEVRCRWGEQDPFDGSLFVFVGRRANVVKALWWSSGGLCLFSKRLERGRFRMPGIAPGQRSIPMGPADLAMLIEGIDWSRVKRQRLHEPPRSLTKSGETTGAFGDRLGRDDSRGTPARG